MHRLSGFLIRRFRLSPSYRPILLLTAGGCLGALLVMLHPLLLSPLSLTPADTRVTSVGLWATLLLVGVVATALAIGPPKKPESSLVYPSPEKLAEQTRQMHQMLEFSQFIQGAGRADQVFATLSHYLRTELQLAGFAMLAYEPDAAPSASVKATWPADLLKPSRPFTDADCAGCPTLRQNLPREFKSDGCPVRCTVDECITLGSDHNAYCIPFNIGRKTQIVCHLLLPPGQCWNDDLKQLAQTYVNTATTTLINLNLLAEAEKQSMTDALTGLFNRRSLDALLNREVALSERHGNPLTLVMIDMDCFKQINDTHGHAAGDHLLKSFADCVRITLRSTDLAFRYGGDEFVIALPQTSSAMAEQVVAKLRSAFASVDFSSAIIHLDHTPTLSIGVAERSRQHNVLTLPQLLAAADLALYDAKAADRNCVRVFTPPTQAA